MTMLPGQNMLGPRACVARSRDATGDDSVPRWLPSAVGGKEYGETGCALSTRAGDGCHWRRPGLRARTACGLAGRMAVLALLLNSAQRSVTRTALSLHFKKIF
eukprot:3760550-Prymnesium_polylepis.1